MITAIAANMLVAKAVAALMHAHFAALHSLQCTRVTYIPCHHVVHTPLYSGPQLNQWETRCVVPLITLVAPFTPGWEKHRHHNHPMRHHTSQEAHPPAHITSQATARHM